MNTFERLEAMGHQATSGNIYGYPSIGNSASPFNRATTADVVPARPVPHTLGMCAGQLNDLHEAIVELERRLVAVLLPSPPTASGGIEKNVAAQLRSELGERLDQVSVGIVAARNRVAMILDRLEV